MDGCQGGFLPKAQDEHALDGGGEVVAVREAEGGQQRDRVATERADKALHADGEDVVVTNVAGIAAVADDVLGGAFRAALGAREGESAELAPVTVDVGTEICENNHGGEAYGKGFGRSVARCGPRSFLP